MLKKWLWQTITVCLVFISRLGILPSNYSPLGSYGFFSGNWILFFGSILAFDYFVGGFYQGFLFTYLGFFAYFLLGKFAARSTSRQLILVPIASVFFFLFSNLGVWWHWYPHTFEGLILCYTAALPFFQNTFFGDMFFGYSFVLVREIYLQRRAIVKKLQTVKTLYFSRS